VSCNSSNSTCFCCYNCACCVCQDEDLEALRQQLAESQQTAEALRGSGVEARAQAQEYGERARRAETLNQEHSADLASLRYLVLDCTSSCLLGSKGLSDNVLRTWYRFAQ